MYSPKGVGTWEDTQGLSHKEDRKGWSCKWGPKRGFPKRGY
jgi:hypothetical protein